MVHHPWAEVIQGYAEADRWIQAERREWLKRLEPEEAWEIFDALYRFWEQTGRRSEEEWAALERRRLRDTLALRRALDRLARAGGTDESLD
ncbi:MAG: hypothetical protein ACPLYD_15980 [Anaerolineae bacterium]|jgi:hypothetical protein